MQKIEMIQREMHAQFGSLARMSFQRARVYFAPLEQPAQKNNDSQSALKSQ
jgi:hypothetical protein